ncbi:MULTISPECIES: hypothetical protein [Nioella]|jgi:hypothetical protein|nr:MULTISPECIES: hypothetical protein [Nioella]
MFCTAHHQPRPRPATADIARTSDRRVRVAADKPRAPGQIFTDFASI